MKILYHPKYKIFFCVVVIYVQETPVQNVFSVLFGNAQASVHFDFWMNYILKSYINCKCFSQITICCYCLCWYLQYHLDVCSIRGDSCFIVFSCSRASRSDVTSNSQHLKNHPDTLIYSFARIYTALLIILSEAKACWLGFSGPFWPLILSVAANRPQHQVDPLYGVFTKSWIFNPWCDSSPPEVFLYSCCTRG